MRLLAWLCLAFLLIAALLQLKPCLPNRSTVVLPHIQGCGRQIGAPILSAQAILKLELLSFKPRDVTGYAFNQSLACLADTAFKRASSISEVVALRRLSCLRSHNGLSQRFWAEGLIGKSPPWLPARKFDHICTAVSRWAIESSLILEGLSNLTMSDDPWAEAKKQAGLPPKLFGSRGLHNIRLTLG